MTDLLHFPSSFFFFFLKKHSFSLGDLAWVWSLTPPHLGDQLITDLRQLLDLFVLKKKQKKKTRQDVN